VRRFFTLHWLWLHVAALVTVATFLGLGWWQVERAGAGNARSYGYAVEWPSLAAIIIFLYVRAIRMELHKVDVHMALPNLLDEGAFSEHDLVPQDVAAEEEDDDPELAAYNEYLNSLHAGDLQKNR
jgi:DNA-binding transcriptional regulator of glucitol operon